MAMACFSVIFEHEPRVHALPASRLTAFRTVLPVRPAATGRELRAPPGGILKLPPVPGVSGSP
jgi:hypothetical protein